MGKNSNSFDYHRCKICGSVYKNYDNPQECPNCELTKERHNKTKGIKRKPGEFKFKPENKAT